MMDNLKALLDNYIHKINTRDFIQDDPILIPHRFSRRQDIEISGFWTAVLAWGQRKTIIKSAHTLLELMDNAPYDFVKNHEDSDLKPFLGFKHRTFQPTDTLYFLAFFKDFYQKFDSLETAFLPPNWANLGENRVEQALIHFHNTFFGLPYAPQRTRKHVATPLSGSTCKRLNMFLRWMVRRDAAGVDFGLWQHISPADLLVPLDVHVERQARRLGLLQRPKADWKAVLELTQHLRSFDPLDPVKYDFALFGMGILDKQGLL